MPETITIVKIGGQILDHEKNLSGFCEQFIALPGKKILVHGGGKLATSLADRLGIQQQMINGRRVTDTETLKIVAMVYAGLINKQLVASLNSKGCISLGVCGADAQLITSHKRQHPTIEYGWVGDIDAVNQQLLISWLTSGITPVVAPITADAAGQLLNTNADTIAAALATALSTHYRVQLVYAFEREGVLRDLGNPDSVIPLILPADYRELLAQNIIADGMIPKLENAMDTLSKGVHKVVIGNALRLSDLVSGTAGTTLTYE
ncbi:MAG: acetylglutamate kinase [Chitinophagia bacterium]|nr:acetylglutamate kinase [Chitinophagia bacterium]